MKKGCLRATFFLLSINKDSTTGKHEVSLIKKTLPKDKNIAFVYLIRKTIMRVFDFMFSVECSSLLDIYAQKKRLPEDSLSKV